MLKWRKSSYTDNGTCVELADAGNGMVAIRNSNRPDDGVLLLPRGQVAEMVQAGKAGELDELG